MNQTINNYVINLNLLFDCLNNFKFYIDNKQKKNQKYIVIFQILITYFTDGSEQEIVFGRPNKIFGTSLDEYE